VLVGWKSGEPFANLVCTLVTCKLSRLCDKTDRTARVEFCIWLPKNQQLQTNILFTDEVMFHRDRITNIRNSQVWSLANPHASVETDFRNFLLRCYCKPNYRTVCTWRALDIRALHPFPGRLIANDVTFSSSYQTMAAAAARRLTRHLGRHVSIKFSKPLDWAAGTHCLATEITWLYSVRLTSLGTYEVTRVYSEVER